MGKGSLRWLNRANEPQSICIKAAYYLEIDALMEAKVLSKPVFPVLPQSGLRRAPHRVGRLLEDGDPLFLGTGKSHRDRGCGRHRQNQRHQGQCFDFHRHYIH